MDCRVLVVDDDKTLRESIVEALESEGYAVEQAADATQALAILRASLRPLAVVLDCTMPGDGETVLTAEVLAAGSSGATPRHAFIPFTAIHGLLPVPVVKALTDLGATVLPKPFELEELFDAVAAACGRLTPGP